MCFGGFRQKKKIKYIVVHYTGIEGDTAKNNCNYFKNQKLNRYAGAHYFVDDEEVCQSIPLNRVAYAVGSKTVDRSNGGGTYYGKCTNENSVSIELCDALKKVSKKQTELCRKLVKKIRKKCPNATKVIRHWDVTGKNCPAPFVGKDNEDWKEFKKAISK